MQTSYAPRQSVSSGSGPYAASLSPSEEESSEEEGPSEDEGFEELSGLEEELLDWEEELLGFDELELLELLSPPLGPGSPEISVPGP